MRPLATPADLTAWLPADGTITVPTGPEAERLILRASETVAEHATVGWTVDTLGDPDVTEVREALRDATCAQVEQWLEVGEENDIAGYPRGTAMGMGSMNLSRLPSILAPRAKRILRTAGLTGAVAY